MFKLLRLPRLKLNWFCYRNLFQFISGRNTSVSSLINVDNVNVITNLNFKIGKTWDINEHWLGVRADIKFWWWESFLTRLDFNWKTSDK